jgi:hypothetical protein
VEDATWMHAKKDELNDHHGDKVVVVVVAVLQVVFISVGQPLHRSLSICPL